MRARFSRASHGVILVAAIFVVAVGFLASALVDNNKRTVIANSEAQADRFVSSAVAALNRNLIGIDVLLASVDDLLGLSNSRAHPWNPVAASRTLQSMQRQPLLVRQMAVVDEKGTVLASSDPSGPRFKLRLPEGFLTGVLSQSSPSLSVSAPEVNFKSSERVLYFARYTARPDGSRFVAIAEVEISQLTNILVQGADIEGLEVTLERNDGQLLASAPSSDALLGKQLTPALDGLIGKDQVIRLPSRLGNKPAIVVGQNLIYRDILIAASVSMDAILSDWVYDRRNIYIVAAVFALMVVGAASLALWYLNRLKQAQISVVNSKRTLDHALESMESGFLLLDSQYRLITWNRRFVELFPYLENVVAPLLPFRRLMEVGSFQNMPHASDTSRQQWIADRMALLENLRGHHEQHFPDGRTIEINERATPDGGIVIVYHDVTRLRQANAEIHQLAFYDPLTGMPNRRLLTDRLQQAIALTARSGKHSALLFIDLDNFKTLNDTSGHDIGDQLLQQVAQRIKGCVRDADTVARLGGDEFVVMLQSLNEDEKKAAAQTQAVCENILQRITKPYELNGVMHQSTCSIGATVFGDGNYTPADLLKQADIAMYQVKNSGRNGVCFFDRKMLDALTIKADLERDLREALTREEFELHYQLQVSDPHRAVGAEVLVRWRHPVKGLVSPLTFITLAEEVGLIVPLGLWVLQAACKQLKAWENTPGRAHLQLAVNVSARQFSQPDFVQAVKDVLHATGANPQKLKLELTESLVISNVQDTIDKMRELKAIGVRFSMDDFGTGQSSLTYLTRLPLDQLKIDQSFIRNIGIQASDAAIIDTIIGLANNLGLEVIAEGVETPQQRDFLLAHGCSMFQGYLFTKPVPIADFERAMS